MPPSAYPMRERSPVPCAQPSPRGDAPSPLAFAKSCKGGDVSVLDPALAWDVRFIYLFISCSGRGRGKDLCSAEREQAPPCPVCDAGRWSCHRRFVHTHTSPQLNLSPAREPRLVPVGWTVLVECVSAEGRDALRDGADGTRLEGRGSAARLALVAEASPSKSRAWLHPQLSR